MIAIGILGAGTWGTALARMLTNCGHDVTVWSALPDEIDQMAATRRQKNLPGMVLPDELHLTKSLPEVCDNKEILLFAVPSVFVRKTAENAAAFIPDGQIIADVAKGIEPGTLFTMTQVIRDEVSRDGQHDRVSYVALSGPTHAEEVARDIPTTIVSSCENMDVAEKVQDIFMNSCMRVYTNPDILGVELCGAVKNVIALAAGICDGLGYGDNTKAALITRGMAEITRLGISMGCRPETFQGLAGIGDLIVTATSRHSRNNRCGCLIGQGMSAKEAAEKIGMVVEGINALPAVRTLAKKYDVMMPISNAVDEIVNRGADPRSTVMNLMTRRRRSE